MTATLGKIEIVDIGTLPGGAALGTAYGPKGQTRDTGGKVWSSSSLVRVGAAKAGTWRASAGTAADCIKVAQEWEKRTKKPFRLTDAFRDPSVQAAGRAKYEAWIAAGKPAVGSSKFVAAGMKAVFVGKVNQSNHQWGGAQDWDVQAMCANDAELSMLWDIADDFGFFPIIGKPSLDMSECWHFDHLGALAPIREVFRALPSTRASAYTETAALGCILAGTFVGDKKIERYAQARLTIAMAHSDIAPDEQVYPGVLDGVLGTRTITCARTLGLEVAPGASAGDIVTLLDAKKIGHDLIAAL